MSCREGFRFPASDLPGASRAWGRAVEEQIRAISAQFNGLQGNYDNTARGISGVQMNAEKLQAELNQSFNRAEYAAEEAREARDDAMLAIEKALEAEGGVEAALQAVADLGETLEPQIQDAQDTANQAAQEAADALLSAQQTASALVDMEGDVQTALTGGVAIDRLYVGGGVFDTAVINTLVADETFSRSLYTNRVIVDAQNLAPGPGGYESAWTLSGEASIVTNTSDPTGRALRLGGDAEVLGPAVSIREGTSVRTSLYSGFFSPAPDYPGTVRLYFYDSNDTLIQNTLVYSSVTSGTGVWVDTTSVAPAGSDYVRIRFATSPRGNAGDFSFRNFDVRPQVGAVLIENGAITGEKVNAQSVAAAVGEFLTVRASTIIGDTGVMNRAFISQLVGTSGFFEDLYANRLIIDAQDFSPGPGSYESSYSLIRAQFVNNTNDPTGRAIRFNGSTSADGQARGPLLPAREGQTFFLRARYSWAGSSSVGGTTQLRMEWFDDPDAARIGQSTAVVRQDETPGAYIEGTVTAPAGTRYARWYAYTSNQSGPGDALLYDLTCRPQVGPVLIEDGAVTADKVDANAINGMVITGATLRTAASGARTQIDGAGLTVYNASNQPQVQIGQGITTGMAVRDPGSGNMVPLAGHVFGGYSQFFDNAFTVAKPASYPGWGNASVSTDWGPFQTSTGRIAVWASYIQAEDSAGQAGIYIDARLMRTTNETILGRMVFTAPGANFALTPPGTSSTDARGYANYTVFTGLPVNTPLRFVNHVRQYAYSSYTGNARVGVRTMFVLPV